jgi:hypothetical protein
LTKVVLDDVSNRLTTEAVVKTEAMGVSKRRRRIDPWQKPTIGVSTIIIFLTIESVVETEYGRVKKKIALTKMFMAQADCRDVSNSD